MNSDLIWVKASRSNGNGAACVEVARTPEAIHVRDSKDRQGPVLTFTPAEWAAFLDGAVKGEFDL